MAQLTSGRRKGKSVHRPAGPEHRQTREAVMSDRLGDLTATLRGHRASGGPRDMRAAFASEPERFARFSARLDDLLLDISKCALDDETMRLLGEAAVAAKVEERRDAMFAGEH